MKEVAILGAGYAGLRALRILQKQAAGKFHITLVNRNSYHYEATDLHEVAAGTQPKDRITYEVKDVVDPKVTTFIQDEVVTINPAKKEVELKNNKALNYDYLVIALGFRSETFGIAGAADHALEMVDIETSVKVNEHIKAMMAKYKETKDKKYLKLVVCGAGFTGIELVGSMVEAKPKYAKMAGVSPDEIEIFCVEAAPTILPMFNDDLTNYCLNQLDKWNVHLMTGCAIKGIEPEHVIYANGDEEKSLEAATIVWTTGVSGSTVMGESGFEERRGRVMVEGNLTAPGHDDVYIIGDVAAVMDKASNRPYPTTAQIAMKMGEYVAKDLIKRQDGQSMPEFTFESAGSVASIGNTHAFGMAGKTALKGYPASFVKKMIMNKSLMETGGMKELMAKGRFDLYH